MNRHQSETDSSDTLTNSSSDTDSISHSESECDHDEYGSECHHCHADCCQRSVSQFANNTTFVNRQVLSQLLKTLASDAKFKNRLLERHLDIVENTLLYRVGETSSSNEE